MGWQVQPPPTTLAVVPGLAVPTTVVQAATPVNGNSPVSVSFAHPVTPGNSIVVALVSISASAAAVTPASGPDTFTPDANIVLAGATNHGQWFHKSNSAGGYSSVTATLGVVNLFVYAYEVLGQVVFDATAAAAGATTFSVNFTPATPAEFLAALSSVSASATLTGAPAAPWVNESVLNSGVATAVGSYQFVSSASTVTYSGTWSSASANGAAVGGYKLTNPGVPTPVNQCILYYFGGQLFAEGTSGVPVLLATT